MGDEEFMELRAKMEALPIVYVHVDRLTLTDLGMVFLRDVLGVLEGAEPTARGGFDE